MIDRAAPLGTDRRRRLLRGVVDAEAQPVPAPGFASSVRRVIEGVMPGDVVTYGEVAREAGFEGAARAVGTLLAREGSDLPWWRVVTTTGRLVPGSETEHAARLRAEGVEVGGVPERVRHRRSLPTADRSSTCERP